MAIALPSLRWGIIGTGLISSRFVADLVMDRKDKQANHIIQAIGSSSVTKGRDFAHTHAPGTEPTVYGSYQELYDDPEVEIVYIGTPHAFHKQNCLDAIHAGKHVLCEKAFALNESDAKEVFFEAEKKNVFVMEAMWTRFVPLVRTLQNLLHHEKRIGDVQRVFCDFSMVMNLQSLPLTSRLRNPALGAGSLLDIGIYSVTWVLLALETEAGLDRPRIAASQDVQDGIDLATSAIISYPDGRQGIATCSTMTKTPASFCRIEGNKGTITVEGTAASAPASFTLQLLNQEPERFEFQEAGRGFYWEADAVAVDIAAGRKENGIMPWAETLRVMGLLDQIRHQGQMKELEH
ncbi:hypothetical protein N7462_007691 [Penicillium macrosclerotiorum]|uniref:uncharacterized protein n=1 Tax=Penicillium macrosclerotiorum TaxID=303699 RepID=UPI00254723F3|nr:uncharacterized protein N7462_007691 [Penicillium macrosclerotiorum]KAJ5679447.1 hypothetical protein N7462_007691 [Penicillium macrosclerotiorum]